MAPQAVDQNGGGRFGKAFPVALIVDRAALDNLGEAIADGRRALDAAASNKDKGSLLIFNVQAMPGRRAGAAFTESQPGRPLLLLDLDLVRVWVGVPTVAEGPRALAGFLLELARKPPARGDAGCWCSEDGSLRFISRLRAAWVV